MPHVPREALGVMTAILLVNEDREMLPVSWWGLLDVDGSTAVAGSKEKLTSPSAVRLNL
ncbi:MAG: hypothetical protein KIS63_13480 [Caldilineales bacterium]|nr:hypothetical protein [Caldilineales bacterium]